MNNRVAGLLGVAVGIMICAGVRIAFYTPTKEIGVTEIVEAADIEDVDVEVEDIPTVGSGIFLRPYIGQITSRFGPRWGRKHTGTDIAGQTGDAVSSADTGVVKTAEYQNNGYGNIVIIDHGNGTETWYAHLDGFSVEEGEVVQKGDKIGEIGNTGKSTGPHLHFEVRKNGIPVDPSDYIGELR